MPGIIEDMRLKIDWNNIHITVEKCLNLAKAEGLLFSCTSGLGLTKITALKSMLRVNNFHFASYTYITSVTFIQIMKEIM